MILLQEEWIPNLEQGAEPPLAERAAFASVFFERDLAARLRDEAPGAYKDISAVMRAQRELVRIVRRFVATIVVVTGGSDLIL